MGWIIPWLPATRLQPALSEVFGNGNALKEFTGAGGARVWSKLKIHMFLTWPNPQLWKMTRSILSVLFSPAMICSSWLPALSEMHKMLVKVPWEQGHLAEVRTCFPSSSELPCVSLCRCCCEAYQYRYTDKQRQTKSSSYSVAKMLSAHLRVRKQDPSCLTASKLLCERVGNTWLCMGKLPVLEIGKLTLFRPATLWVVTCFLTMVFLPLEFSALIL